MCDVATSDSEVFSSMLIFDLSAYEFLLFAVIASDQYLTYLRCSV